MLIVIILLSLIGFVIVTNILVNHFKIVKPQTITFFSGGLGTGKSLIMSLKIKRDYSLSVFLHYISFGKIPIRQVYTNYPLVLKGSKSNYKAFNKAIKNYYDDPINNCLPIASDYNLVFSNTLCKSHILGDKPLPQKCIIGIDEASSMFPNQAKKSDEVVIENFRWFRHYTNGNIYMADQSIGDIDIAIRRRINMVYNLSSFTKIYLLHFLTLFILKPFKVDIDSVVYMEDVSSFVNVKDVKEKSPSHWDFLPKKPLYESRYNKYNYIFFNYDYFSDVDRERFVSSYLGIK